MLNDLFVRGCRTPSELYIHYSLNFGSYPQEDTYEE